MECLLKGSLLRYHYGVLDKPWKPIFLDYLITDKIMSLEEIDYDMVQKKCRGVLKREVHIFVRDFKKSKNIDRHLPLHILAQKVIVNYKVRPEYTVKAKEFRDKIIAYYDNI